MPKDEQAWKEFTASLTLEQWSDPAVEGKLLRLIGEHRWRLKPTQAGYTVIFNDCGVWTTKDFKYLGPACQCIAEQIWSKCDPVILQRQNQAESWPESEIYEGGIPY
jgi:hypothetical protein